MTINVGDKLIGDGHPTFIIAEVGQAHDGSLATAHAYIDAVAISFISDKQTAFLEFIKGKFDFEDVDISKKPNHINFI